MEFVGKEYWLSHAQEQGEHIGDLSGLAHLHNQPDLYTSMYMYVSIQHHRACQLQLFPLPTLCQVYLIGVLCAGMCTHICTNELPIIGMSDSGHVWRHIADTHNTQTKQGLLYNWTLTKQMPRLVD